MYYQMILNETKKNKNYNWKKKDLTKHKFKQI